EVTVNTRDGWLFAWKTPGKADGVVQWESFHHDNRNTGNLNVPLENGKMLGAEKPLELDDEGKCVIAGPLPDGGVDGGDAGNQGSGGASGEAGGGGCGCDLPGGETSRGNAYWLLGAVLPLVVRRRRKR